MRDRQVPTVDRIIRDHERRIRNLEARLTQIIDSRRTPGVFSFSGLLDDLVGSESPKWRPTFPCQVDLIVPELLVAPSGGDVTIDLTLYGPTTGVVRTLTIPDGFEYAEDAVPFVIPIGGSLTATVTDSNGAESLSIALGHHFL